MLCLYSYAILILLKYGELLTSIRNSVTQRISLCGINKVILILSLTVEKGAKTIHILMDKMHTIHIMFTNINFCSFNYSLICTHIYLVHTNILTASLPQNYQNSVCVCVSEQEFLLQTLYI